MVSFTLKPHLHKIGLKHGLTDKQVEDILRMQFRFVAKVMSESDENDAYPVIHLPMFGKFIPKYKYMQKRLSRDGEHNR